MKLSSCAPTFAGLAVAVISTCSFAATADETPLFTDDTGQKSAPTRFVPKRPKAPLPIYYNSCKVAKVKPTQKERKTRIAQDIATLFQKFAKPADAAPEPGMECVGKGEVIPIAERVDITLVALDDKDKELGTMTVVYGPEEHLSLGIDLPVSNRKTLKYDTDSQSLVPKDDKQQFYISLNHSFGDVLDSSRRGRNAFDVKIMVLASRKPLDSYGVGVGYRLDALEFLGIDLKGFSVFGGYFSTVADKVENDVVQTAGGRKKAWRVGVSYDLSPALNWVKF